jgi:hypothetical protein
MLDRTIIDGVEALLRLHDTWRNVLYDSLSRAWRRKRSHWNRFSLRSRFSTPLVYATNISYVQFSPSPFRIDYLGTRCICPKLRGTHQNPKA